MSRGEKLEGSVEPARGETRPGSPESADRLRITSYVGGDETAIQDVDSWIRSELRRAYPGLRHEHEDLVQATHVKLLVSLRAGRFEGRSSLRSYVTAIAHCTAIDRLRRVYRYRGLEEAMGSMPASGSPNPYAVVERGDERRQAQQVLLSMPESCRALWRLVFVERLSYQEVAGTLAISPGTVKSRMWYCRQKAMTALQRLRSRRPPEREDRRP